jgi:branched-chain amino acid transport system permease protein
MQRSSGLYICFVIWVIILCASPLTDSNYMVRIATNIALFTALAQSWNFIGGFTGYPSFSTAAFFGLGAYTGAITQNMGLPMGLSWLLATVGVALFAGVLGIILLRLRGHYFAIGSIALVEVARLVVASSTELTGGGNGMNVRLFPGGPDAIGITFLYSMVSIMVMVVGVTIWVDKSRLGFGLRCIKQNEDAAGMVGINTTLYKVMAYILSAAFCGTVGAVYASWVGYIDPTDSFEILLTLKVPVMALMGGAGTVLGPVLGAGAFTLLEEFFWAHFLEYNFAILGFVIVVLIFYLPNGLLRLDYRSLWRRLNNKQLPWGTK